MNSDLNKAIRIVTEHIESTNLSDESDVSDTSSNATCDTLESLMKSDICDRNEFGLDTDDEDDVTIEVLDEAENEVGNEVENDYGYDNNADVNNNIPGNNNDTIIEQTIEHISHNINAQLGYGCKHYLRRCSIFAECCQEFFVCHRCHDDVKNPTDSFSDENHEIDRKEIKTIKCSNCNKIQHVQQYCEECNVCFGFYFCEICKTIDDVDKDYFHCNKCEICRVGRGIKYVHCDTCKMCYSEKMQHKCIEVGDCPICYEDLKTSTVSIHKLNCGHNIHQKCFSELIKTSYKCPMCQKSVADMKEYIKTMDTHLAQNPMPAEYKNEDGTDKIIKIYCNDCEKYTDTAFHFVGLKCMEENCGGYNTTQI